MKDGKVWNKKKSVNLKRGDNVFFKITALSESQNLLK